jgi:hypothetical protein
MPASQTSPAAGEDSSLGLFLGRKPMLGLPSLENVTVSPLRPLG